MRRLFILILLSGLIAGCSSVTSAVYGPGLTPDQLKDAIYEDAYSIGTIRAGKAKDDLDGIIKRAQMVKAIDNPTAYITKLYFDELRKGELGHALLFYSVRRLLDRIGIKILDQGYEAVGFDRDLFVYAVDTYIKAVEDFKGGI